LASFKSCEGAAANVDLSGKLRDRCFDGCGLDAETGRMTVGGSPIWLKANWN